MCKGSNTTTGTSTPNPTALSAYNNIIGQAGNVAATPYTPYTGEMVTPVNSQQQAGIAGINANANFAQPYIQQAAGMATSAAQPITQAQINQYENPFTQQVVGATQAQFNNSNAQQQQGVVGNAISQGALGGNRVSVAQAQLANQQNLAQAPVIAGLESSGYQQGVTTAEAQQQAMAQGAYSVGNLGVSGQNAALTGAGAQIGAGTLQQTTQQAQDTANYQQYINQAAYPYQSLGWEAGIDTGVGSQMGGTSSTTAPPPNPWSTAVGAGTLGVGILGATGGFGATGYLSQLADGGVVGRASGGSVETVPESKETLHHQQRQLIAGHRDVHMFPHGTEELSLPKGAERVKAPNGDVFHFNPQRVSRHTVLLAAAHGRENDLLGLGPFSKDDIARRVHGGEIPVAVVERAPDGHEVRAAAGTHVTAPVQLAHMDRGKSPGHTLHVEDPRHTIARRSEHHRANGGVIPGFAAGGAPGGVAGVPWANATGYVPAMQITHGPGAPKPPGVSQQPSLAQQASQIGALSNAFGRNNNAGVATAGPQDQPGGANYAADQSAINNAMVSAGVGGANDAMISGTGGIYRRGGSVRGYDDGGIVSQDFNDLYPSLPSTPSPGVAPRSDVSHAADGTPIIDATDVKLDSDKLGLGKSVDWNNPALVADRGVLPPQITGDDGRYDNGVSALAYSGVQPPRSTYQGSSEVDPYGDSIWGSRPTPGAPADQGVRGLDAPVDTTMTDRPAPGVAVTTEHGSNSTSPWVALMSAGLGMMASRSPFFANAVGEGGLAGLQTYSAQQKYENEQAQEKLTNAQKNRQIELEAQRITSSIKHNDATLAETIREHDIAKGQHDQPFGWTRDNDGNLIPTPGGPQDPATVRAQAMAKRLPGMDDEALHTMVQSYRAGNTAVLQGIGRGPQGPENLQRFWNMLSTEIKNEGGTGADLAAAKANFGAQSAAARSAAVRESQVQTAIEEARNTFPLALQRSAEVPRTQWVPINRALEIVRTGSSSPEMARFVAANEAVITAYSQAMSRTGANSVHAQERADKQLKTATSPEAYEAVIGQLQQEMDAAVRAPETVRKAILNRIGIGWQGEPRPAPNGATPAARSAPAGTPTAPPALVKQNGHTYQLQADGTYKAIE